LARVTDRYRDSPGKLVVIADMSPPRSGEGSALNRVKGLGADFISVAYNPGRLVRMDSRTAAYAVQQRTGTDVVFTLATRDMNKIAMGSQLLGAQTLGLENVVVVQGDRLTERETQHGVSTVDDFTATSLIASIATMNKGLDYRGGKLSVPTKFCIGATLDLGRGADAEAILARRKVEAGADFFISQPIYAAAQRERFLERYQARTGEDLLQPVFWGLQVLERDGVLLSDTPTRVLEKLEKGKSGTSIAIETLHAFMDAGVRGIYLVPPILKGGARDYEAAQRVLANF
jgi:5,10-methylenetetrahydrofolate reductase